MIAIFNNQAEAIACSNEIHSYLLNIRPTYNATKWADPIQGDDGKWSVKLPVEYEDNRWGTPLDLTQELSNASTTETMPSFGVQCVINKYYLYNGDTFLCRQTHNRTIYEPKDTPALFSYFRENSDQLQWYVGEQVMVGWMRIYDNIKYKVIQAHQTQSDWTPPLTPALWKIYVDPLLISAWAPGVSYIINQFVTYGGNTYKCIQSHTSQIGWEPPNVPALWLLQ